MLTEEQIANYRYSLRKLQDQIGLLIDDLDAFDDCSSEEQQAIVFDIKEMLL